MTVSDDESRLGRKFDPDGTGLPVRGSKGWRKLLRCIWQTLRVFVQVNGLIQLVRNGESPVSQWVHEALNFLLHVIRLTGF